MGIVYVLALLGAVALGRFVRAEWTSAPIRRTPPKAPADLPPPGDPRWEPAPSICNCGDCGTVLRAGDVIVSDSPTRFSVWAGPVDLGGSEGAQRYAEDVVAAWRAKGDVRWN